MVEGRWFIREVTGSKGEEPESAWPSLEQYCLPCTHIWRCSSRSRRRRRLPRCRTLRTQTRTVRAEARSSHQLFMLCPSIASQLSARLCTHVVLLVHHLLHSKETSALPPTSSSGRASGLRTNSSSDMLLPRRSYGLDCRCERRRERQNSSQVGPARF